MFILIIETIGITIAGIMTLGIMIAGIGIAGIVRITHTTIITHVIITDHIIIHAITIVIDMIIVRNTVDILQVVLWGQDVIIIVPIPEHITLVVYRQREQVVSQVFRKPLRFANP